VFSTFFGAVWYIIGGWSCALAQTLDISLGIVSKPTSGQPHYL
jgi:hypothetical protein